MNKFKEIVLSIRFLGILNTLRTILSTLHRDFIEWRFRRPQSTAQKTKPGPLRSASVTDRGGNFEFTNAELEIRFLKPDLINLTWKPGKETPAYARSKEEWPRVSVTSEPTPQGGYALSTKKLTVTISTYGKVVIKDKQDQIIRTEHPPRKQGERWFHDIPLEMDEKIHGLGEKAGPLNLRDGSAGGERATYEIRNQDIGGFYSTGDDPLYLSIPLYLSRKAAGSYMVFYENPFHGKFSFDPSSQREEPQASVSFCGGRLQYYIAPGPPSKSLKLYSELTGRPPLPPKWALGYHQCRWGYKSNEDVQQVVEGFQRHEMPLSALHLDIDYMQGYRVFTINEDRFPDLRGLSEDLGEKGIQLVTILDPGVKKDGGYFLYQEGMKNQYFCTLPNERTATGQVWPGTSVFPDFSHPDVRNWWGEKYNLLLDQGVRGFWHDMNEPSAFKAWGEPTLPQPTMYHLDGLGGNHTQVNNLYGFLMNKSGFQGLKELQPQKRPWILSRSGWAGNQRYAWNWTGDVSSSWQALRQTVVTMLHLGISGIPYTGSDIGGFEGHPSAELFTRWFQLAAFTPFFRGHSAKGTPRREPWVYGEPYTGIIRKFLEIRYQLLPYLYTLAWKAHRTGHPLMRPLFWEQEPDPLLDTVEDEFLLGENLLVAPVLEEGQRTKQVILPKGDWFSFWDDTLFSGPARVNLEVDERSIPLFVKAGSVLPLDGDETFELHIYPPQKRTSRTFRSKLYQDEGEGYGPHRVDTFALKRTPGTLRLNWKEKGDLPLSVQTFSLRIHGNESIHKAAVDDENLEFEDGRLDTGPFKVVEFVLERTGENEGE